MSQPTTTCRTTKTTCRTTKITAMYVAIRCTYIDPSTSMMHCTARKDMVIDASVPGAIATNDAKVELKIGDEFYLVRSDSLVDEDGKHTMFYIVKVITGHKRCSCPARKPCKHEIAVQAKVDRRMAVAKATALVPAPKPMSIKVTPQRGPVTTRLTDVLKNGADFAPLNGNRGFSLMRR